ncbi:peptidoglycan-binding domain-containing protein [Aliisedimentitalea scapharcae]|uniref:Peptidoglycan-binding domain-containing protein n=1 Tax=Aliisedimentitalea scapharcae TaxID=1524259 RepID=A0ABZ2XTA8_9RHOB
MSTKFPFRHVATLACLCAMLAGCEQGLPDLNGPTGSQVTRLQQEAPPGATPGTCWGKQVTPAVIETVTHQIMIQPAQILVDGTVTSPAIFKTETIQQIVRERTEEWFETPCDDVMTPQFIASLQRALKVRSLYRGQITAEMDTHTQTAIRKYQKPHGLDTGILSLATARKLGLVEVQIE